MRRVIGLGGVFFKSKDPQKINEWYNKHLGIPAGEYGANFDWLKPDGTKGTTVWCPFKADTKYFAPSDKDYMFNYRVENLEELLKVLREEGVTIAGEMQVYDYGKFGWILDPEGNKIELWEPLGPGFEGPNVVNSE